MIKCLTFITDEHITEYRKNSGMSSFYYNRNFIVGEDTFFQNALDILG